MKRGKEGEKVMEPMFPRLHVKDTDKGGPRAPPRNKMALYEQLSIPSHRFSHVVLPSSSNNTAPSVVHQGNQGSGNDRSMSSSGQVPPKHPYEQQYSQYSNTATSSAQVQKRKRLEEDDYRVPVFDHSMYNEEFDKYSNGTSQEKLSPSRPHHFTHTQKGNETGILESSLQLESTIQKKNSSKDTMASWVKSISCSSSVGKSEGLKKLNVSSLTHEPGDKTRNIIGRLLGNNSLQEHCSDSRPSSVRNITPAETATTVTRSDSSNSKGRSPSEDDDIVHDVSSDTGSTDMERSDSLSETSILDTISAEDVTPDDVVSMIGQKHFWKARRAITNQQRVFAIQVFELHRLIKVQKLIAASPHLLLEESPYFSKPIKALSGKKPPLKATPNVSKEKDGPEKPSQEKESFAENTIENTAPHASCQPASGISQEPSNMNPDHNPGMSCYNPAQGHQWLVPVMSPSEGLIYKLYPGPGFAGQACGGCSLPGSFPVMGNFMAPPPAYGIPAPHPQYQLPSFPPVAHGYFPPYSMPVMNAAAFSSSSVEQRTRQQSKAVVDNVNSRTSEEIEVQASTSSSVSQRQQASNVAEGRNMLPFLLTSSAVDASKSLHCIKAAVAAPECPPGGVIRVVPHNAMSASESVARIFRSIQEGRKRHSAE